MEKLKLTEQEWLEKLGPERYRVLRQKGTERAFTGEFHAHFEQGHYHCGACGELLFQSDNKFDSHCGWPSFDKSMENKVERVLDKSHGMIRAEVVCANCNSHLGHVFNDGPTDTGERYCVNSASLDFENGDSDESNKEDA